MNLFSTLINFFINLFRQTSPRINLFSNLISSGWSAALGILFMPVYIRYLGIETYGIIGIFASIQAFLWMLDLGLSPTLNRELARLSSSLDNLKTIKDTIRTLEVLSWFIAFLITIIQLILSPLIALYWVKAEQLSISTITHAFWLISLSFCFQLTLGLYSSGLQGLQRQLWLNIINIIFASLRYFGAFYVISQISPTIEAFLLWQLIILIFQNFLVAISLKKSITHLPDKAMFQFSIIKKKIRFAGAVTAASGLSLVILQMDKIILSKVLTLENFGYYSLAAIAAATAFAPIVSSISNTVYPLLSQSVAVGKAENTVVIYHKSCQVMSVVVVPITVFLATFSQEILRFWMRNETVAAKTEKILSLMVISIGISCLKVIPYNVQLAYGWARLSFYSNLTGVIVLIPTIFFGAYRNGAIGAAIGLIIFRVLDILLTVGIMHRKVLKNEFIEWLSKDIGLPVIVSIVFVISGKLFLDNVDLNIWSKMVLLGLLLLLTAAATGLSAPFIRQQIIKKIGSRIA